MRVFDAAVQLAYGSKRKIAWMEILAGEKAFKATGEWMPAESLEAVREFKVAIKGPLTTPVGGGIRSLNVALRQELDLYACIRPVRYFKGVGAPMKHPEKLNIVIFRENIEDVYSGIEFRAGTPEAEKLRAFIEKEFAKKIREGSAIGIKPMSPFGSKRLVKMAIEYALKNEQEIRDADAQGQHHEVHGRRLSRLGLRDRARRVQGARRRRGRSRQGGGPARAPTA